MHVIAHSTPGASNLEPETHTTTHEHEVPQTKNVVAFCARCCCATRCVPAPKAGFSAMAYLRPHLLLPPGPQASCRTGLLSVLLRVGVELEQLRRERQSRGPASQARARGPSPPAHPVGTGCPAADLQGRQAKFSRSLSLGLDTEREQQNEREEERRTARGYQASAGGWHSCETMVVWWAEWPESAMPLPGWHVRGAHVRT